MKVYDCWFCGERERIFCANQWNISGRKCATIRLNLALIDLSVRKSISFEKRSAQLSVWTLVFCLCCLHGSQSWNFLRKFEIIPGVPKKVKCLFDHRTKGFCSIIKFTFGFNKKHSTLDVETNFTKIRHELTAIHYFKNWQVDFNCQNFADFRSIDFHYTCTLNNMPREEIFAEDKLKWSYPKSCVLMDVRTFCLKINYTWSF